MKLGELPQPNTVRVPRRIEVLKYPSSSRRPVRTCPSGSPTPSLRLPRAPIFQHEWLRAFALSKTHKKYLESSSKPLPAAECRAFEAQPSALPVVSKSVPN